MGVSLLLLLLLRLQGARGDWVPPEGNGKGLYPTGTQTVAAFTHTLCVALMADIATALGYTDDAQRYTLRLAANRKAYHAMFFNNATGAATGPLNRSSGSKRSPGSKILAPPPPPPPVRCCYSRGSQTDNVFALYIGAVPDEHINATLGMLVASIHTNNATRPWQGPGANSPPFGPGPHMNVGIFGCVAWAYLGV